MGPNNFSSLVLFVFQCLSGYNSRPPLRTLETIRPGWIKPVPGASAGAVSSQMTPTCPPEHSRGQDARNSSNRDGTGATLSPFKMQEVRQKEDRLPRPSVDTYRADQSSSARLEFLCSLLPLSHSSISLDGLVPRLSNHTPWIRICTVCLTHIL